MEQMVFSVIIQDGSIESFHLDARFVRESRGVRVVAVDGQVEDEVG